MGVLTASGGACDIVADAASAQGLEIPDFSAATEEAIGAYLPPFANARNPLDVTAYGSLANLSAPKDPLSAIDRSLDIAADDPNLDFILFTRDPARGPPGGRGAGGGDRGPAAVAGRADRVRARSRSSRCPPPATTSAATAAGCWPSTASPCSAGCTWGSTL